MAENGQLFEKTLFFNLFLFDLAFFLAHAGLLHYGYLTELRRSALALCRRTAGRARVRCSMCKVSSTFDTMEMHANTGTAG